jgi:UDP-N-acetylglucosamine enolpyruvyl transferase
MATICIEGGVPLEGDVCISGAKNAVLPILVASILGDAPSRIGNVPHLQDVTTTMELLGRMGARLGMDEQMKIEIDPRGMDRSRHRMIWSNHACIHPGTGAAGGAIRPGPGRTARGLRHWFSPG